MVSLNVRGPTPAPDVSKLKGEALKEAIKDWFLSNFEDPAENTPYESAEGGYQYIWGGPYDANEELYDNFPNVPEEIIEGIVDELQET
ncbi:MAG TPA: hypothetical protein VJL90_12310, partial [Pseudorhodoplanes sp.]|nr:hypothetical protein [Pseudorhodoplanes sp.]